MAGAATANARARTAARAAWRSMIIPRCAPEPYHRRASSEVTGSSWGSRAVEGVPPVEPPGDGVAGLVAPGDEGGLHALFGAELQGDPRLGRPRRGQHAWRSRLHGHSR